MFMGSLLTRYPQQPTQYCLSNMLKCGYLSHIQASTSQTLTFCQYGKCCGQGDKGKSAELKIWRTGLCLSIAATVWVRSWATHFFSLCSCFIVYKMGQMGPAQPTFLVGKELVMEQHMWECPENVKLYKILHKCIHYFIRKWQPTPVFLPGESHGQRSLVGHGPWGCRELDTTEITAQYIILIYTIYKYCVLIFKGSLYKMSSNYLLQLSKYYFFVCVITVPKCLMCTEINVKPVNIKLE